MSQRSRLLMAAAMGLLAALACAAYLTSLEHDLIGASAPAEVCVATQDILANATLDDRVIKQGQVPARYLQPLAVSDCQEALGRMAAVPVPAGAQVLSPMLLDRRNAGLAPLVTRSHRAITIGVDPVTGVGGLVRPGNLVDIFATVVFAQPPRRDVNGPASPDERTEVRLLMQRIPVLAVGQELLAGDPVTALERQPRPLSERDGRAEDRPPARDIRSVTLSVTPRQAQEIVLAQQIGELTLTLRATLDSSDTALESLDPLSLFQVSLPPIKRRPQNFSELHGPMF